MKKIMFILTVVIVFIMSLTLINAFTTPRGTEWNFIWGERDSRPMMNRSLHWVERIDHPNGSTHWGHFEWEYHNWFTIRVPYVIGLTIEGNDYYKNYNFQQNKSLSKWNVPIGNRNMGEFGECREYEIRKGVCVKNEI